MITIGIDPHKDTHTAAAVEDATGQLLGELTVPGTEEGHQRLRAWAHELAPAEAKPRFALRTAATSTAVSSASCSPPARRCCGSARG